MPPVNADVVIVGSGLGATALARSLAGAGRSVVLVPGIGRTRSPHLDGGIVTPGTVEAAFGSEAPLGDPVPGFRTVVAVSRDRFEPGESVRLDDRRAFRRNVLEEWAMERAVEAGAVFLEDVIEGKALPSGDGSMTLTSEQGNRSVRAGLVVLCEGADPRIPLRVKLRPDYGPEDQIHFARTIFRAAHLQEIVEGTWRTSWGMPLAFRLVPQHDGVLITVVGRIENVMRSGRSTADGLADLQQSPAFASLGIEGAPDNPGMELVALRPRREPIRFVHDRLMMGIDASGLIDPRSLDRADLTIRAGLHLGEYLLMHPNEAEGWSSAADAFIRDAVPVTGAYHEDRATGYLEEGPFARHPLVTRLRRIVRRGR
jgi:flavin-dependent dehydrogenase